MVNKGQLNKGQFDEGSIPGKSLFSTVPLRGRKTRWVLLIANAVVVLACAILPSILMNQQTMYRPGRMFLVQVIPTVLMMGPFLLVLVIAAWGPHRLLIRAAWLVAFALYMAVGQGLSDRFLLGYDSGVSVAWMLARSTVTWIAISVPAALMLAMLGSWRGLRLAPASVPKIRVSIGGIMVATAVIGVLVSARAAMSRLTNVDAGVDYQRNLLGEVMIEVMLSATVLSMFAFTSAVASRNWIAFVSTVVLAIGLAMLFVYGSDLSSLGIGRPELMMIALGTMAIALSWVMCNVFLLHRSGWELARR